MVHEEISRQTFNKGKSQISQPFVSGWFIILYIGLHFIIASTFSVSTLFPTIHALLVFFAGLFFLLTDDEPTRVIYVLAYISGADVLWRGFDARIFWEFGKYSASFLLILMILKYRKKEKIDVRGIIYFVLLIPAIFLLPGFDRELIGANLGGPFALAVAITFFSNRTITKKNIFYVFIAMIGPAAGLAFMALQGIFRATNLVFYSGSLFITSAGIGPNQVSSTLSLGALAVFFCLILIWENRFARYVLLSLFIWFVIQTVMTFSRGGFWTLLGAVLVAGFFLMQDARTRGAFLGFGAIVLLLSNFVFLPMLDGFTGSALSNRFASFDLTGRGEIVQGDLMAFVENPFFGVGPGQSMYYHAITYRFSNAHTEYTRMLAEHGLFGAFALLILIIITLQRVFGNKSSYQKMFSVAFTVWALLYMAHSATRTLAPSLLFGMASLTFLETENPVHDSESLSDHK